MNARVQSISGAPRSRFSTPRISTPRISTPRTAAALLLSAMVFALLPPAAARAGQGTGSPRMVLSTQTAQAARVTDITVSGFDYLVPPHAPGVDVFGGVYVFFGWVADANTFGPSNRNSQNNNGVMGVSYIYPGDGGDPGTRDPGTGTMRMVAFTTGSESGRATEFHMDREGNWTTKLRIYSSVFSAQLPSGEVRTIDCMKLSSGRCGVFTVGAHSKTSATNEKFVPISFTGKSPVAPPSPASPGASVGSGSGAAGGNSVPGPSGGGATNSGGSEVASPAGAGTQGSVSAGQKADRQEVDQKGVGQDGESGAVGGKSGTADDEVSLGDAGTRRRVDTGQTATDAKPIVATVRAVESDGVGSAAWIVAVGFSLVAVAAVVVRRRRRIPSVK